MDKVLLYNLLIYISVFGISDNILNHFKIDTKKRILIYTLLFIFTYVFLRSSISDKSSSEKDIQNTQYKESNCKT